ncbi:UNVERIFIED_CONTAM: hypothetical protein PYX00_008165 [Menopon gallinae]|uniref:Allatotropin n=1 Tax=Menopon gallinae TaxID=328185 RepID=A0AAW2HMU7_9NEOP
MKTVSNVYLIGFALTICIAVNGADASSNVHNKPRTIRGFKNAALSTARGFGKRDGFYQSGDSVNDLVEDARRAYLGEMLKEPPETERYFPVEWFVEELTGNPKLARLVVKKFIDQNQDGELSAEELFRSAGY